MHFCFTGQYTPQAVNKMLDNPTTNRYEATKKLIEAAGLQLISIEAVPVEGPMAKQNFIRALAKSGQ